MIKLAAFVPDSPLLIKEINETDLPTSEILRTSFVALADLIKSKQITTIIILGPGAKKMPSDISLFHNSVISGSLSDFGRADFSQSWPHNVALANRLAQALENSDEPIKMLGNGQVDYTFFVPLHLLKNASQGIKIIPITVQNNFTAAINLGKIIRSITDNDNENILLLASGEICRASSFNAKKPQINAQQQIFTQKVINLLNNNNNTEVLNIPIKEIKKMNADSIICLLTLLACVGETKTKNIVAAQADHMGVSFATVLINL
jgi:aromatic ring-opening dioxygenase LigB subunit